MAGKFEAYRIIQFILNKVSDRELGQAFSTISKFKCTQIYASLMCQTVSVKLNYGNVNRMSVLHPTLLGPKKMFAERDKHYPSRSGQSSLATAVTNITKPVTKNNFGPSTYVKKLC